MKKVSFYADKATDNKIDILLKNTKNDSLEALMRSLITQAYERLDKKSRK